MKPKYGALAAIVMLAIPLAVAATAFACGNLATLKLDRGSARPGAQVVARGGNYNSSPNASPVQIRFNSRVGRILWEGRPGADGRLRASFAVPAAKPGYYVILGTQTGPDGRPAAGTPGRVPLRIRKAKRSTSASALPAAPLASPPGADGPPPAASVPVVAGLGIGLAALGLLGGGFALARTARRRRVDVVRSLS